MRRRSRTRRCSRVPGPCASRSDDWRMTSSGSSPVTRATRIRKSSWTRYGNGKTTKARRMIRRDFFKTPLALAGLTMRPSAEAAAAAAGEELAQAPGLTRYVAEFITGTRYEDVPDEVVALGKKTLLDGFGLALAGSASVVAPVVRQYIGTLGVTAKSSTVVGTAMKVPARFAAFANGVSIHADDYDDTGPPRPLPGALVPPRLPA